MGRSVHRERYLAAWRDGSPLFFAYDSAGNRVGRAGNSWAATFWAGFDGAASGVRVPPRGSLARPLYDAGRDARRDVSI